MTSVLSAAMLAQDSGADAAGAAATAGAFVFLAIVIMIEFAVIGLMIAGMWKVFVKAGEPGWAAIVPIYNGMILMRIAGKPEWWILLCFIPVVGLVIIIMMTIELAKAFGQGGGFTAGLIFLPFIFFPILGFGSAQYIGPVAQPGQGFPVGPRQ